MLDHTAAAAAAAASTQCFKSSATAFGLQQPKKGAFGWDGASNNEWSNAGDPKALK